MSKKRVFLVLICCCLVFIWGNSCLPVAQSRAVSEWVLGFVRRLFGMEAQPAEGAALNGHSIRKIAHFLEFAALGVLFVLVSDLRADRLRARVLLLLLFGLAAALVDETIQCFSDRGPRIPDVWLDFAGYLVGCLAVLLLRGKGTKENTDFS